MTAEPFTNVLRKGKNLKHMHLYKASLFFSSTTFFIVTS